MNQEWQNNLARTGWKCISNTFHTFLRDFLLLVAFTISGCIDEKVFVEPPQDRSLDPTIVPAVVSTYPPDGAIEPPQIFRQTDSNPLYGNGLPHFRIKFNKTMLQTSINAKSIHCFGIETSPEVYVSIIGERQGKEFDFTLYSPWSSSVFYPVGKKVTVTVDTTVMDIFGNHPSIPYTFSFEPERNFRVLQSSSGASQWVIGQKSLPFYFNSEIDSTMGSNISVNPPVAGVWKASGRTLNFVPESYLKQNLIYRFSIGSNVHDRYGNVILDKATASFQTPAFRLSYLTRDTLYGLSQSLEFGFTYPLDKQQSAANCSIEPTGDHTFRFSGYSLLFTHPGNLKPLSTYTVTIRSGLMSAAGDRFGSDLIVHVVVPRFRVSGEISSNSPSKGASIHFICNGILDVNSVSPSFSISPHMRGHLDVSSSVWGYFSFVPDSVYQPNTEYKVSIAKTLQAEGGYQLQGDYSFKFTTSSY